MTVYFIDPPLVNKFNILFLISPWAFIGMVVCGIFMSMGFSRIVFSMGLNINYTVILKNFLFINITISIGIWCFNNKNVMEKQFYRVAA